MPYKKTNEAWFGDSFNRGPMTMSFNTSDGNTYTCAVNNMSIESDYDGAYSLSADIAARPDTACFTVAKGVNSRAEGAKSSVYGRTNISAEVDTLSSKLQDIQAQIDGLKVQFKKMGTTSKLRLMLKTLNYTSEI